jgi:hypothetical protein
MIEKLLLFLLIFILVSHTIRDTICYFTILLSSAFLMTELLFRQFYLMYNTFASMQIYRYNAFQLDNPVWNYKKINY